jgi:molecular chaperone GrpE
MEETKDNLNATLDDSASTTNPEAEEYYAQLQRVMADFDNYRKRVIKEKDAQYSVILSEVITELLPVVDNLEKSLETSAEDEVAKAWKNGVELIYRQFSEVLNKLGAEEIKAVGEQFDPNYHDAVMHVEDENLGENVIVEELRKGYKLKDRIIRHSMVKVAN